MTWRTHAACGIALLWVLSPAPESMLPSGGFGLLAAVAAFGSLLPDLDAPVSKLSAWSVGGIRPLYPVAKAISGSLGHRGPLHSWPGLILAAAFGAALVPALGYMAGASLWLGYASHLAADACTISGIPSFSGRRLWLLPRRLRIVTGSPPEDIVFAAAASVTLWLLLAHLGSNPQ